MLQTVLPEKLRGMIASNLFQKYVGVSEDMFARELYMDYNQIRVMNKAGMFIGVHGYDHYWLAKLERDKLVQDIEKSLEVMGDFIDTNAWVMNYPYGDYSSDVIDGVSNRGCVLGLTTDVRVADLEQDSRYELPRLDCNDFPPKSENYKQM